MPLPNVALAPANTAFANRVYAEYTPPGANPVKVAILGDLVDYDGSIEVKELLFPGTDGILRPIRRDQTQAGESFSIKCYDLEKVTTILGGMNGFASGGTVILWITDPTDAANKVRFKTDDFPCTAQREGQVKFGGQEYTSATLKFTSTKTSAVTFNKDAAP